jgi:two-component system NtrC family sensor kinase
MERHVKQQPIEELKTPRAEKLIDCQRLALLGRLSSNLTHEINNHLTGVSGYAQLLLGQERAKELAKELEKIYASANECKKLISSFKRFAGFQNQEKEFNSLNIIIQQVLELYRRQFMKTNLQINEDFSPDLPVIEINAAALEQVFLNIIQNAFEALHESGSRLTVTTRRQNNRIIATLEDDGPGFSPEAMLHLFEPFFSTKQNLHCAGLGLATAKMLLEKLGGQITVETLPKAGARVMVILPLEESD